MNVTVIECGAVNHPTLLSGELPRPGPSIPGVKVNLPVDDVVGDAHVEKGVVHGGW